MSPHNPARAGYNQENDMSKVMTEVMTEEELQTIKVALKDGAEVAFCFGQYAKLRILNKLIAKLETVLQK